MSVLLSFLWLQWRQRDCSFGGEAVEALLDEKHGGLDDNFVRNRPAVYIADAKACRKAKLRTVQQIRRRGYCIDVPALVPSRTLIAVWLRQSSINQSIMHF